MSPTGKLAAALLAVAAALPLAAQQPKPYPEPARQLVRDVIWNELHDRERFSHWEYLSTLSAAGQIIVREQVETSDGPVFRVLERDGALLSAGQQEIESRRVQDYIRDPSAVARVLRDHQADEARLASIMRMLPRAFLFRYDGPPSGGVARLSFRPNPAFVPSGYEARIVHALAGTLTVNLRYKRMIDMRGVVAQPVDFGFGLLGHVDPGGTFEIHRCQVSPSHWKTDLVDVHVQGRILMFKTISKNEREARSDFHPVPVDMTLAQASRLLSQAASDPSLQPQLAQLATASTNAVVSSRR